MSSGDDVRLRNSVLGIGSLLAVLLAAVAVLAPGAVPLPPPVRAVLTTLPPGVVLAMLVFVGVVLLLVRSRGSRADPPEPLVEREVPTARATELGSEFDDRLATATDLDADRARRLTARESVEATVRDSAVEAYALDAGVDREAAARAVESGAWTEDRRASALVGGPGAPSPSRLRWLLDLLLTGSAYRRRVRHAVAEVERLLAGDPGEGGGDDGDQATETLADGAGAGDGGASA
ncbi:DUF7269 family protein [Haloglomus halophilum]|uniref:DUF7269 family protein n=1 Tax=Haloglomus halophilum TaxID=2962672 RepID=UPI0020CA1D59|nr:hypothetical protein [Haloglomus halophilum]